MRRLIVFVTWAGVLIIGKTSQIIHAGIECHGDLKPCQYCGNHAPELGMLTELAERNQSSLENAVTDEQKAFLERYIASTGELTYLKIVHAFRAGFSFAARLLADILPDQELSVQRQGYFSDKL